MWPNCPKISVDLAPNRIEFLIRFDLPIAKPDLTSGLKFGALVSGVRQFFFSRNLVNLTPCDCLRPPRIIRSLTRTNWSFAQFSYAAAGNDFFYSGRCMAICIHGQEILAMRSPMIEDLTCTVSQRTPLWETDRDLLLPEQQRWAIVWTIVFLFAERNFRLRVNRNIDRIFGPVLPEPNRIFGLLNLSTIILLCQGTLPCNVSVLLKISDMCINVHLDTCVCASVCVCHNEKKSARRMASTTSDTDDTSSKQQQAQRKENYNKSKRPVSSVDHCHPYRRKKRREAVYYTYTCCSLPVLGPRSRQE